MSRVKIIWNISSDFENFNFDLSETILWIYWNCEGSTLTRRGLGEAMARARQNDGEGSGN